jgi:hypothetical protein
MDLLRLLAAPTFNIGFVLAAGSRSRQSHCGDDLSRQEFTRTASRYKKKIEYLSVSVTRMSDRLGKVGLENNADYCGENDQPVVHIT